MPELPDQLAQRLKSSYNLNEESISFLKTDKDVADYFEEVIVVINKPNLVINWIKSNVMQVIKREKITINEFKIKPARLAELIKLIDNGQTTKDNASKIFDSMLESNLEPAEIMSELGLEIATDNNALTKVIISIFEEFPDEYKRCKSGENKLVKFFMGQAMKKTKGKYPPASIMDEIKKDFNG